MRPSFVHLGFGLGFRPCHYSQLLTEKPEDLDWLEVITENFLGVGGRPREVLEQARAMYPVALHGVGLSIGSPEPVRFEYLNHLKHLVTWLNPVLISDHLCFTSLGRHNSHDLLPLPYTEAVLARVCDRLNMLQDHLGRQIMLENPSAYVSYASSTMSEAEFICRMVEGTGCGLLLDLNNLIVNHKNLGLNPNEYLTAIPAHAVGQIHLSGHTIQTSELGTVRIDTHDQPICDDVWDLYQRFIQKFSRASIMIEWDAEIPTLSCLLGALTKARDLRQVDSLGPAVGMPVSMPLKHRDSQTSDDSIKSLFALAVAGVQGSDDENLVVLDSRLPVSPLLGSQVYHHAYFGRLRDVLKDEFPTLAGVTTDEGFNAIAASYLAGEPPSKESMNYLGAGLAEHLKNHECANFDFGVSQAVLSDLACLDRTRSEVFIDAAPAGRASLPVATMGEITPVQWETVSFQLLHPLRVLTLSHDATAVWQSVQDSEQPAPPTLGETNVLVWRKANKCFHASVSAAEAVVVRGCIAGLSFASIAGQYSQESGGTLESTLERLIQGLVHCFERGLVTDIVM